MPLRWWIALCTPPVGFVMTMIVFSMLSRDYSGIPKALEFQGMALITLGLAGVCALYGRAVGRVRACPVCKTTWSDMVQVGETETKSDAGPQYGQFTKDGWKNGAVASSVTRYELTCRKCQHKFRRALVTKSRSLN